MPKGDLRPCCVLHVGGYRCSVDVDLRFVRLRWHRFLDVFGPLDSHEAASRRLYTRAAVNYSRYLCEYDWVSVERRTGGKRYRVHFDVDIRYRSPPEMLAAIQSHLLYVGDSRTRHDILPTTTLLLF